MKQFEREINTKDTEGRTLLHGAAVQNAYQDAAVLLAQGAEVNAQDAYGETPLHRAERADADAVVDVLVAHAAAPGS